MASVLVGVGQVYITGMEGVRLKADQTLWLFFETAALFGISFFIIRLAQTKWLRFLLLSFMTMGFLWIHQVFLPVLVSGAYLAAVIRCGSALRRLLDRYRRLPEYHGVTCMADLTLGCGLLITVFCLMSLAGSEALETPGWRSWSCWPCRFFRQFPDRRPGSEPGPVTAASGGNGSP